MSTVGSTGLTAPEITGLLAQATLETLWLGEGARDPEIAAFLQGQHLPPTEADFIYPGRDDGKLSLAFSGQCADKVDGKPVNITDGRFDPLVRDTLTGLKGPLGRVVCGGTMWSFMPELVRVADKVARVPVIGVMPESGFQSLMAVRGLYSGADPLPPMDKLAVVGTDYTDAEYVTFMADCAHGMVNIGGRGGAAAEVDAMRQRRRPVYLAPTALNADAWIQDQVMEGLIYPRDVATFVNILRNDFIPYQVGTMRAGLSFREHLSPHQFKARHINDVVLGIVSTSGAKTNHERMMRIIGPLMRGLEQRRAYPGKVFGLGGMTMQGGISVFYNACLDAGIETGGIMCWKGANEALARGASEMVIVGNEWSDESAHFLDLIDILLVVEPGNQGWKEAMAASQASSTKGRVPVIVVTDPVLARGRAYPEIPGAIVIESRNLSRAIEQLNAAVDEVVRQRRIHP